MRTLERRLWWAAGGVAVLVVALALGLALYGLARQDVIYNGVEVQGIALGGLTREAATQRLEDYATTYASQPITLTVEGQTVQATPAQLGFDLDAAGTADRAFDLGRHGGWWGRSQLWMQGLTSGLETQPVVQVNQQQLDAFLQSVSESVMRPARDAQVQVDADNGPVVVPEEVGVGFDLAGSRLRVMHELQSLGAGPVPLLTFPLPPAVKATDLQTAAAGAAAAVDEALVLQAAEGNWTVDPTQLRAIVRVNNHTGAVEVKRDPGEALVQSLAAQIDQAATDAGIAVSDTGELVVVPGVDSALVDVDATVDAIVQTLTNGGSTVDLIVRRAAPAITDEDAARGIQEAERYIADGVTLTWPGGEQRLGRSDLLAALIIEPAGGDPFLFSFDTGVLSGLLDGTFSELDDPAVDARFRIVNETITVAQASAEGQLVDRDKTLTNLVNGLFNGERDIPIVIKEDKPEITEADKDNIQLPDVLAQAVTYYSGSSEPRKRNVERGVELQNGWLIPPDGIFSFVENVGDIDEGNGFATGFGIVADEERGGVTTAPVMGGGICQVSTTVFQAAWWTGLEVVERYQHPYWLTSYGQPPLGMDGLDAMVNIEEDWALDLKLRNTTGNWIAIIMSGDGNALTASIVGTNPRWTVEIDEPVITDRTEPSTEIEYADSPELPAGQELQVETAQAGFTAEIQRTVRDEAGNVVLEDGLTSEYAPARNLVLRGTGS
jgi:vancomycin resistance protein YoaR